MDADGKEEEETEDVEMMQRKAVNNADLNGILESHLHDRGKENTFLL